MGRDLFKRDPRALGTNGWDGCPTVCVRFLLQGCAHEDTQDAKLCYVSITAVYKS